MRQPPTNSLEEVVGHQFHDREVLDRALTHSSHAREKESAANASKHIFDNEQLEFLGDAVLGFVTSQELFRRFPEYSEGELSKLKAHLVSARHLIRAARELELGKYLRLGRGEEKTGGRAKSALLVDALEALIAALFLDGGLDRARHFILARVIEPELQRLDGAGEGLSEIDHKSKLQEILQASGRPQPAYVLVHEEGPEHRKTFTVEVRIAKRNAAGSEVVGRGEGPTKKKAEQIAAREVLGHLVASDFNQQDSKRNGAPRNTAPVEEKGRKH
jgi:ribonuclease III